MAELNESPFIRNTLEWVKNFVSENYHGDKKDDREIETWIDEHINSVDSKISFRFENCEEMAEAISYVNENDNYSDFNQGQLTVQGIMANYIDVFIRVNYSKIFI